MHRENKKIAPVTPDVPVELVRPKTRGDCVDGPRPCPFLSCRHNLLADVSYRGSVQFYTHQEEESCSLDVAERGGLTLSEVGYLLDITRERTRQLEVQALSKLRSECRNPSKND